MTTLLRPRRPILYLCVCVTIAITGLTSLYSLSNADGESGWPPYVPVLGNTNLKLYNHYRNRQSNDSQKEFDPLDSSHYLVGELTPRFRDNIRNDTYYITSWANAGFTNQFISLVNLLYLATLSDRVPILPPFAPDHHISRNGGIITFGEIFNLTHLRKELRMPVLEWKDIKDLPSSSASNPYDTRETEAIGCWSTREEAHTDPVRAFTHLEHLGLDPSYTRVPGWSRRTQNERTESHVVFSQLAAAVYPRRPRGSPNEYPLMEASRRGKTSHRASPDERLTCFDTLYYATSGAEIFEWRFGWSPAWNKVGRHVLFNEVLVDRSREYLRTAFGLEAGEEIPPFIAIHIRHGDFGQNCNLPGHCLSSVDSFEKAVKRVEGSLVTTKGVTIRHWLVSSDETDPAFWDAVSTLGWSFFDHEKERTLERFGEWLTPLVDMVAHSLAAGFVGTSDSTFSLVGGRRVEDWNDSVYELVE